MAVSVDQIGLFDVQIAISSEFPIGGFQIITTGILQSYFELLQVVYIVSSAKRALPGITVGSHALSARES